MLVAASTKVATAATSFRTVYRSLVKQLNYCEEYIQLSLNTKGL